MRRADERRYDVTQRRAAKSAGLPSGTGQGRLPPDTRRTMREGQEGRRKPMPKQATGPGWRSRRLPAVEAGKGTEREPAAVHAMENTGEARQAPGVRGWTQPQGDRQSAGSAGPGCTGVDLVSRRWPDGVKRRPWMHGSGPIKAASFLSLDQWPRIYGGGPDDIDGLPLKAARALDAREWTSLSVSHRFIRGAGPRRTGSGPGTSRRRQPHSSQAPDERGRTRTGGRSHEPPPATPGDDRGRPLKSPVKTGDG